MTPPSNVGLPEALERAATALRADADDIRPANGDPTQLRQLLTDDAATRVLRWLLEHEPDEGGALANAWAEDPDLDPGPLLAVSDDGLAKAAKKGLRRARHRLRSRGVTAGPAVREPVVAKLGRVEDEIEAAAVSAIDPSGSRVVYLVEANPSGGARIFEAILDEQRGVVGFDVYGAGRSKVRRFLREITRTGDRPAVAASPASVRALIARIAGFQPDNRPAPRGFSEWRTHVAASPEGAHTPGELAREALSDVSADLVPRVVELIREREIGPWPPEDERLQAAGEKIAALGKSELVVPVAARREQADDVIAESLTALYGGPYAARCAERFDETAYVYWKWGRVDDARAFLAAADGLRGDVPEEQPTARAMLEVLMTPVLDKLDETVGGEESSPIVQP